MRKITAFLSLFLLGIGQISAEEGKTAARETKVGHRTVTELNMHQAILQKIRSQGRINQPVDLSQLIKESDAKETDDTHRRDYDAEVRKIFDSLY